ncbi:MAG: UbiA family prenyltransferase [Candidatus Omnitrophica bacterium]|jgi:4-hydroxybenzoate polyprenyltransferase|nr:UbiA family prenyltransferase [Candidatus Omnitrophota bacterium]MDD5505395.1 UbiA family prenyltransferase [Candidatus Omnitrophota bacterium]
MEKIKRFIRHCEESSLGFGLWIAAALAIIFIRDSLESLISTQAFPEFTLFHLLHVPVFFLTALISIIVLLRLFTREDILKISKISLVFLAIIILPVSFDLIAKLATGAQISYEYVNGNVRQVVLNFFNPFFSIPGVPYSLRIEIFIICVFVFIYVFLKTNKVLLSALAAFLAVGLCVFYGTLPGLIVAGFVKVVSLLWRIPYPFLRGRMIEGTVNESVIVIVELIFALLVTAIWFRLYDARKFRVVIRDFRVSRYLCYFILLILGLVLYLRLAREVDALIFVKVLAMSGALFFALRFSALINDIFDVDCDVVSNKSRPLITGIIDRSEYLKVGAVYLVFSLLFAIWVSAACFMITLFFTAVYFLYSAPPFRLKRLFIFSSLVTGVQAVLTLLMGQLSLAQEDTTVLLYPSLLWLAFLIFSLGSNIKDLKDIEGDRRCGVYSLPVIFGEEKGRKIIALLVLLSYLFVPLFLYDFFYKPEIVALSLLFGVINYLYIRKVASSEKPVFLLYFIYFACLGLLLL